MPNFDFKFDENDIPGSLAKLMRYLKWFNNNLDETNVKLHAWGDSYADNVDATHKFMLKFYVPDGMLKVQKLLLNFSLEPFRAYETGAASGGGATTSNGGGQTTSSGGGTTTTSSTWTSRTYNCSNNLPTLKDTGETDGHTHSYTDENVGVHDHEIPSHDHTISIGDHTHTVSDHTHTVGTHTHAITYGIYESTSATGVKVYVDGTLRLDNGGAGYTTDQANIDLTEWVTTSGWHYIELSSTQLGRINAAYFIECYIGTKGISGV